MRWECINLRFLWCWSYVIIYESLDFIENFFFIGFLFGNFVVLLSWIPIQLFIFLVAVHWSEHLQRPRGRFGIRIGSRKPPGAYLEWGSEFSYSQISFFLSNLDCISWLESLKDWLTLKLANDWWTCREFHVMSTRGDFIILLDRYHVEPMYYFIYWAWILCLCWKNIGYESSLLVFAISRTGRREVVVASL